VSRMGESSKEKPMGKKKIEKINKGLTACAVLSETTSHELDRRGAKQKSSSSVKGDAISNLYPAESVLGAAAKGSLEGDQKLLKERGGGEGGGGGK